MKQRKQIQTTIGDLIVSLTDETLKIVPARRSAYRIVAALLAGLPVQRNRCTAGALPRRRFNLSPAKLMIAGTYLGASLILIGCMSTFEPRMSAGALEAPRLPSAKEVRGGVEVSVEEYFSSHKSRRAFDADVGARGVLPLLIHIENRSGQDYRLERRTIKAYLNGQALPVAHGIEAAEIGALRNPAWNALVNTAAMGPLAMFFGVGAIAGSATQTQKINRQVEQHFERMELTDRVLKSNETATGFVFFKISAAASSPDTLQVEMILDSEPIVEGYPVRQLAFQFTVPALVAQP